MPPTYATDWAQSEKGGTTVTATLSIASKGKSSTDAA
jgi:hypothetical protein